ncbi:multiubiquitin domain-containing protein [Curtobacterium sp. MWU13-2055]|uniref:multiubiquitin domain-containing protein n=1 Tax=Curtobacterium sp. MWU13-2055 TaxID=2931928 RepID=UPI00200BDC88|nr:multiubiquitin domain-containing protein [Curtobacterium sp. MWU13-2055]
MSTQGRQRTVIVHLDGEPVELPMQVTGHDLAAAASTPPAAHVWIDVADGSDRLVGLDDELRLTAQMRFYTDKARTVFLDSAPYTVTTGSMSEAEIRSLPTPPLGREVRIWIDLADKMDEPLRPGSYLHVTDGVRFFSRAVQLHIFVNGRKRTVTTSRMRFEDVVELAFPDDTQDEAVTFTVTFTHAAHERPEGILAPGGSVTIKEGTRLNVTRTTRS